MIYALIKNGLVVNTFVLVDTSKLSEFSVGYDACIEISQTPGSPGVGWLYDGSNFTAPPPPLIQDDPNS